MKRYYALLWLILQVYSLSAQNRYDVIIDEVMADPTPPVGLPNNEWIELKNISGLPINLAGWRIGDANGQSGAIPAFILQPDSFVIICGSSSVAPLSAFGKTLSVTSFPSLDNETDLLFLKAANTTIIHAVNYDASWYSNEMKKEGGWSLEMIDTKNPCAGKINWKASVAAKGGTPGTINSVNGLNTDIAPPLVINSYTTDSTTIILVYDEPVDSASGAMIGNYTIDGNLTFIQSMTIPPLFNQVLLKTNHPMQANMIYTVTVNQVIDCKGNAISTPETIRTGIPADPDSGEIIINEILFDPRPGGYDYVEFYNSSKKIFDASHLYIANRNSNNQLNSPVILQSNPFYIFPGDYAVITENADNLAMNYLVSHPKAVLTISSLPSLPDTKGTVVLLNASGSIADEVSYDANWHFKLLANTEGVSLERIDANASSQNASNWHSAASTAGYGTPGYKNSQYRDPTATTTIIQIDPAVFSPDNDGFNDVVSIKYNMEEPGNVANITIFDAAGRPVRNLVRNNILGRSGYWNWDGLGDKEQKLTVGIYIVFTEIFNLQGKKQSFKNTIVLTRKF